MPSWNPNRQDHSPADKFLETQKLIAGLLARLFIVEQQKAAEQVPHEWQGHLVLVGAPVQLLPANTRRGKLQLWNDGPSDLFIGSRFFDSSFTTLLQQFNNGVPGVVINATIAKNGGDKIEIESTGPVFGIPVAYGQAGQNTCTVRMVETLYRLSITGSPTGLTDDSLANAGHKWRGLSEIVPEVISTVI